MRPGIARLRNTKAAEEMAYAGAISSAIFLLYNSMSHDNL
jgi:hypothetical protein